MADLSPPERLSTTLGDGRHVDIWMVPSTGWETNFVVQVAMRVRRALAPLLVPKSAPTVTGGAVCRRRLSPCAPAPKCSNRPAAAFGLQHTRSVTCLSSAHCC
jgi:hypothetical protein